MTIQLDDSFLGLWFVETIPGYQNYLCALHRTDSSNSFRLIYRWRYHKTEDASEDEKKWYETDVTGSYDEVLAKTRSVAAHLARWNNTPVHELIRGPMSVLECSEAITKLPFTCTYHPRQ